MHIKRTEQERTGGKTSACGTPLRSLFGGWTWNAVAQLTNGAEV